MRGVILPQADTDLHLSDESLMLAIQKQDTQALATLYGRYCSVLKAMIIRIVHNEAESEDLLQEIFMELWNHSSSYLPAKGKPLAWIVTLARRRAIDRLRKRQSYARVEQRFQQQAERCLSVRRAHIHQLPRRQLNRNERRSHGP